MLQLKDLEQFWKVGRFEGWNVEEVEGSKGRRPEEARR
jgi:hypothetical protein